MINTFKYNNFTVYPWINGMSDHDAQIIVLHDITNLNVDNHFYFMRNLNTSSVLELNIQLTYEPWKNDFAYDNVNLSCNNFLNTYLRLFHSSFPIRKNV